MSFILSFHIWYYCHLYAVDPTLVHTLIHIESSHRASAIGPVGEQGLLQIRPKFILGPINLLNPETNLALGIFKLAQLKSRLQTRLGPYWFAAWNLGPTGSLRYARKKNIRRFRYVRKVKKISYLKNPLAFASLFPIDHKMYKERRPSSF